MLSGNVMRIMTAAVIGIFIAMDSNANDHLRIDFDAFLWKYRPLLLFGNSPDTPEYQDVVAQLNALSDEIIDRDMVIIEVFDTGLVRVDTKPLPDENAEKLRKRFSVAKGSLTAILIGKDGGQKLRQTDRIDLAAIFALIDTMPMRQREMRNK